jgi:hypothetical protein
MSHDCGTRRACAVLLCFAFMAVSHGCRRSPFQRLFDGPMADPPQAAANGPDVIPPLLPVPDSASRPQAPATPTPAPAPVTISAPPPLSGPPQAETFPLSPIAENALAPQRAPGTESGPESSSLVSPHLFDPALTRVDAQLIAPRAILTGVERKEPDPTSQEPTASPTPMVLPDQDAPPVLPPDTEPTTPAASLIAVNKSEPEDPALVWRKSLERLKQVAQESASQPGSADGATLWRVRAQVIDWLSSERSKPANAAFLKDVVTTIANALRSPARDDTTRTAEIHSAVSALEERVPLGISELRLCRNVLGFGAVEPLEAPKLKPGQNILVYCEPTGLRFETRGDASVVRLSSRIELVSAGDGRKVWEQDLGAAEDQFPSRRRDCFVNYRIALPSSVAVGDYRLRLFLSDQVANSSATAELPVTLTR